MCVRVEFFLKMHIVVICMFLHSCSHSSSTKITSFKSNFNWVVLLRATRLKHRKKSEFRQRCRLKLKTLIHSFQGNLWFLQHLTQQESTMGSLFFQQQLSQVRVSDKKFETFFSTLVFGIVFVFLLFQNDIQFWKKTLTKTERKRNQMKPVRKET